MTNERNVRVLPAIDVRWLDERALHASVIGGDPEAFAELMRRYDPVVRHQVWRVLGGSRLVAHETLDERVADIWCALLDDASMARLRDWDADRCGLLATWIAHLAACACADRLRALLKAARDAA
jgi:hypothetical protein